jgi:hypothetical protein
MTNAGRTATVALVAAMAMMVAGRANAQDEPTAAPGLGGGTIVLHVTNYAALSREILDAASARVAMVYQFIGVRTVWVDGEVSPAQRQDGRLHFTVLLLSREMAERKISAEGLKDGVLGQAHAPSGRASIFCDRIATMPGPPTYFANPLGDVIAHEVGHLVLGVNSHTRSGIMRPNTDVRALPLQSFDKTQARAIHTTLRGLTADVTVASRETP